jgi:hypothetical protein
VIAVEAVKLGLWLLLAWTSAWLVSLPLNHWLRAKDREKSLEPPAPPVDFRIVRQPYDWTREATGRD